MNKDKAFRLIERFCTTRDKNAHPSAAEQTQISAFIDFLYEHGWEIRLKRGHLTKA